jgi:hypothetical protein
MFYKTTGFVREFNDVPGSIPLLALTTGSTRLSAKNRKLLIDYMKKSGEMVFSWMGYFVEPDTGSLLGPDCYYSDGIWVWPGYLVYYVENFSEIQIEDEFIRHVVQGNAYKALTQKEKEDIENFLSKFLSSSLLP